MVDKCIVQAIKNDSEGSQRPQKGERQLWFDPSLCYQTSVDLEYFSKVITKIAKKCDNEEKSHQLIDIAQQLSTLSSTYKTWYDLYKEHRV